MGMSHRLGAFVIVALALGNAAGAADVGATDPPAAAGLSKAGNAYVLADEASVLEAMKALRAKKVEADKETKAPAPVDPGRIRRLDTTRSHAPGSVTNSAPAWSRSSRPCRGSTDQWQNPRRRVKLRPEGLFNTYMRRAPSPIQTPLFQSVKGFAVTLVASEADIRKARTRGSKKIAFGWYGGKYSHLDWLLPLLPECHHYCEPFAGSAAVLLNRGPSPVETYNDVDGEVTNFFRTLRDQPEELVRQIGLTPFSREEFFVACQPPAPDATALERARRFFVRARQVRTGLAQTASIGRWANCKNTTRAGMSGVVSRWLGSVDQLPAIAERLLRVQVENRPAMEVIELYDSERTLFYCDPPYVHGTRTDAKAYGFEMSDQGHRTLARCLHAAKGRVALSGYRGTLYEELFAGWRRVDAPVKICHSVKKQRAEALWVNFEVPR